MKTVPKSKDRASISSRPKIFLAESLPVDTPRRPFPKLQSSPPCASAGFQRKQILIMKPALLALALLLVSALSPLAQTDQAPTTASTQDSLHAVANGQTTNSKDLANEQSNQDNARDIDTLLNYQEFLQTESDRTATQLEGLIQHTKDWISFVGWCAGGLAAVLAAVLSFLNFTTFATLKKLTQAKADEQLGKAIEDVREKMQATSEAAFEARLRLIDSAYSRRQKKYLKLLWSFFEKLLETNPELVNQLLGPSFKNLSLKGKRALWVEDDGVGIALLVVLLEKYCGLEIEIVDSTEKALAETLANYHLVISNLRRDPHEDAGIRLTEVIRADRRSQIPVIIFTRAHNAILYQDAITAAGATAIATSHEELLSEVAKCLRPKNPTPKKL